MLVAQTRRCHADPGKLRADLPAEASESQPRPSQPKRPNAETGCVPPGQCRDHAQAQRAAVRLGVAARLLAPPRRFHDGVGRFQGRRCLLKVQVAQVVPVVLAVEVQVVEVQEAVQLAVGVAGLATSHSPRLRTL